MNQSKSKKLTSWIVTALFIALVTAFSLLDQPTATAQLQTPSIPTQSTPAPVISPAALPTVSVKANVKRLLSPAFYSERNFQSLLSVYEKPRLPMFLKNFTCRRQFAAY